MVAPTPLVADCATVVIDETTLLSPISFTIERGQMWCLSGPNGSGKTTLLRAFLDHNRLTAGRCLVFGAPASTRDRTQRASVSALVDPIPIARDLSIHEQLLLLVGSWYGNEDRTGQAVSEILDRLRLAALTHRFPHQVSAGQLQLFNLALALVRPAEIVLLDEPERHLDVAHIGLVKSLLADRAQQGTAFLVATHEPTLIEGAHGHVVLG